MSVRELARVHGVHRRTVRAALADSTPPPRKAPVRVAPAVGPWLEIIRAWLVADLDAPRKQRHTARRLWQRLVVGNRADGGGVVGLYARWGYEDRAAIRRRQR